MPAPDGLLVVDKPADWTSHDVVARCRRLTGTRKVGHAGTLDPMATGVLVVGVGRATRLLGRLALSSKTYEATIRLGQSTVSDDSQGEVTASATASHLTDRDVEVAAAGFVGDIEQVPSAVSAIKVHGERSYKLVREGKPVALAARNVSVSRLDVVAVRRTDPFLDVEVQVECSTGTYIRALGRDIGACLGVGGHLTALRRTRVGCYDLDQAHTLESLLDHLTVVPLEEAVTANFPTYTVGDDLVASVRNGRTLSLDVGDAGDVAVFSPDGEFLALYEQRGTAAHAVAVFAPA
ncbi:MAG: tRNA pseudouridine(55) synthase TruB [Nocardioidaceae bacterium]|nr:tRNA pseudouridine(55) synthase TruB [Nocardioidaceae bacterium]